MASVVQETPYQDRRIQERRRLSRPSPCARPKACASLGAASSAACSARRAAASTCRARRGDRHFGRRPGETRASTIGTGAGIWAGVSLLLALFLGGLVATRIGATSDRTTGFFEGALVWVVSVLLMGYLATSGISTVAGGVFAMLGGATKAVGSVMQAGGTDLDLSGNVDQMLQRLGTRGRCSRWLPPPACGLRGAGGAERRSRSRRADPRQSRTGGRRSGSGWRDSSTRRNPAERCSKRPSSSSPRHRAAWITLGALLLSLLAAVLGAMAGRRRAGKPVR